MGVDFLWEWLGVPALVFLGAFFSWRSRFFQIRKLPSICKNFWDLIIRPQREEGGVSPVRAFFASIGGCIGIGNVVAVCTAVQMGGPGALFWIWVAALAGMLLKYAEIYLGIRHRIPNARGGYDGGPMFYLQHAFSSSWIPKFICALLCIYGVEVYMFSVVSTTLTENCGINHELVVFSLFCAVMLAGAGGVKRVGAVCSAVIPFFLMLFMGFSLWILATNASLLPSVLYDVITSAFTGKAAVGAFAGSSLLGTLAMGVRYACYTGDLGVGYASVIHSESSTQSPHKQAALGIVGIILDTFVVCTLTLLLVLISGTWNQGIAPEFMLQTALEQTFPQVTWFIPALIFLLGYSTMIAYLCVGFKCADFLSPRWGRPLYSLFASVAFLTFSYVDSTHALGVMGLTGGLLLLFNCIGIYRLRHQVEIKLDTP